MSNLELVSPFSASADVVAASTTAAVGCRAVVSEHELALHLVIRRAVFVDEQGVFATDDRDDHDDDTATVHVLGTCGAIAAGAVRLYPTNEPGVWKGDRLAVLPQYRNCGLGGPLVRFAVRTAGALGGSQMVAFIQPQNVPVFEHLGWRPVGQPTVYVGRPHQQMCIGLTNDP